MRFLLVPALIVAAGMLHDSSGAAVCRIATLPDYRDSQLTHFVAVPTADTVAVPYRGAVPFPTGIISASGAGPAPPPPALLAGQLVRLQRIGGRGAATLATEQDAVLVPWNYRQNCEPAPMPWPQEGTWLPVGQAGFFTAHLRPHDQWVSGHPTFDVVAAWHQPYPYAGALRYELDDVPLSVRWLTLDEYWSLYEALPTATALESDPVRAVTSLRGWEERNPGLTPRFPASKILASAYWYADYLAEWGSNLR